MYERRHGKHTRVHFLSGLLRAKGGAGGLTNESEVSFPSDRRISAYVVVVGVLRPTTTTYRLLGSSVGASALQTSGRHRTTLVRDAHCLGSARRWVDGAVCRREPKKRFLWVEKKSIQE